MGTSPRRRYPSPRDPENPVIIENAVPARARNATNSMRWATVVLVGSSSFAGGARILFFTPLPAKSHHSVYRPIVRELAERGHDVVYYTPFPVDNPPPNLKTIIIDMRQQHNLPSTNVGSDVKPDTGKLRDLNALQMIEMTTKALEMTMKQEVFQSLLKTDEKFDLVMTAAPFMQPCFSALSHRFKASRIDVIPVGDVSFTYEAVGAPENPAYMMNMFTPFSDEMGFSERLENTWHWLWNRALYYYLGTLHQDLADKYLTYPGWESRASIMEMTSDAALVLLNSHPSVGYSFPKPPHFKEIGGINVVESKPLPEDVQAFLDDATEGAIYFSLGSVVQVSDVAGGDMRKTFVEVFSRLRQKVLWKWEADVFPDKPANVFISKWFPQQDILAHNNVKVFITQGGMMSTFEAVSRGVPLLGIPFFGDQRKNLKHASTLGYGLQVDYTNITDKSIQWALEELLHNPRYKIEAEKRAKLFKDRPMKPMEEAIYWIEYVLRHGKVLQPASARLPFYKRHLLDIIAFVSIALLLIVIILKRIGKCCKSIFFSGSTRKIKRE